ncbi:MAG: DUF4349 domain-containing protein [Candidatus Methanofastidiosia archaeon]
MLRNRNLFVAVLLIGIAVAGAGWGFLNFYYKGDISGSETKDYLENEVMYLEKGDEQGNGSSITLLTRQMIKSGYILLEVENFESSQAAVSGIAQATGGWVESSSVYEGDDGRRTGYITIRVPSESFEIVLSELEKYGQVKSEQTFNIDVTEEYIDLEARLENLQAQEERYLELLEKAQSVEDILKVEVQLERIRGNIESLQGRLNYLESQVEMSRIQINLEEPTKDRGLGIVDAFRKSGKAFVSAVIGIIIFFGYFIPVAILFVLCYFGVKKARNKIKAR